MAREVQRIQRRKRHARGQTHLILVLQALCQEFLEFFAWPQLWYRDLGHSFTPRMKGVLRTAPHGLQQLLVPLANQLRIHKAAELMPDMVQFGSAKLFVDLPSNARLE